jgi:hypothetical protein
MEAGEIEQKNMSDLLGGGAFDSDTAVIWAIQPV